MFTRFCHFLKVKVQHVKRCQQWDSCESWKGCFMIRYSLFSLLVSFWLCDDGGGDWNPRKCRMAPPKFPSQWLWMEPGRNERRKTDWPAFIHLDSLRHIRKLGDGGWEDEKHQTKEWQSPPPNRKCTIFLLILRRRKNYFFGPKIIHLCLLYLTLKERRCSKK